MPTQRDGINLCKQLQPYLEIVGLFPALTGGLLYKDGARKDIDVVIYRHRQDVDKFEIEDTPIKKAFKCAGVEIKESFGFVTKATWCGFDVDIFHPETNIDFGEEYGE